MSKQNRYVVKQEQGRKWADVYDTSAPGAKGQPGKLVMRGDPATAEAAATALN